MSAGCAIIHIFFLIGIVLFLLPEKREWLIGFPLSALSMLFYIKSVKLVAKEVYAANLRGLSNPYKMKFFSARIAALFTVLGVLALWPVFISIMGMITGYPSPVYVLAAILLLPLWNIPIIYFQCCDPLPPGKSKAKKWLETGVRFLRETLTPAPRPKPVPVPSS